MIVGYYRLVSLSNELKEKNKIKVGAKIPRYDCIEYIGDYKGITPFVSKKGQFYLNLHEAKNIVKTQKERLAEFMLTYRDLNFSSMYFEDANNTNVCYGYPNGKPLLKDGSINPLFKFRNDLYIILINDDLTEIEVFIFEKSKAFASDILQKVIDGFFDEEIEEMREKRKTFFNY